MMTCDKPFRSSWPLLEEENEEEEEEEERGNFTGAANDTPSIV